MIVTCMQRSWKFIRLWNCHTAAATHERERSPMSIVFARDAHKFYLFELNWSLIFSAQTSRLSLLLASRGAQSPHDLERSILIILSLELFWQAPNLIFVQSLSARQWVCLRINLNFISSLELCVEPRLQSRLSSRDQSKVAWAYTQFIYLSSSLSRCCCFSTLCAAWLRILRVCTNIFSSRHQAQWAELKRFIFTIYR